MVGWHHWLNGQEYEKILQNSEGQATLACCSLWGHKESDITEPLSNNTYLCMYMCVDRYILPIVKTRKPRYVDSFFCMGIETISSSSQKQVLKDFRKGKWRRKQQPTPVFLPGESQGRRSLMGCRLWGRTELDTTEATQQQQEK